MATTVDYWLYWAPSTDFEHSQIFNVARKAEQLGYKGIALPDHITIPQDFKSHHPGGEQSLGPASHFIDPMAAAASILAVTNRLEVTTFVFVLPMRDPLAVAKQVAALNVLSNNRFRFGVGAGWLKEEFDVLGQTFSQRGKRMDEMIIIMRKLWNKMLVEHTGEYYQLPPLGMAPKPRGHSSIWIGGKSQAALQRAVRNDGWLGMNYPLDELFYLLDQIGTIRREKEGDVLRSPDDFSVLAIPLADEEPTPALYSELAGRGLTSTVVMPWAIGDPAFFECQAKLDAMSDFAEKMIATQ